MNATEVLRQAHQFFQLEQFAEVEQLLLPLLGEQPENVPALHLLGAAALAQAHAREAALVLQRALRIEPGNAAIAYKLGRAYYEQERYQDAYALYRQLIDGGQRHAEFYVAAASALQAMPDADGRRAQALHLIEQALQLQPQQAELWHRKTLLQEEMKQVPAALESLQRALQLDDQRALYWLDFGLLLHKQQRYEEALPYFDRALTLDSGAQAGADAWTSKATSLSRLRRYEEAIECYRLALKLNPDDVDAKVNLALSLLVLGRLQEAWPLYEWRWEGRSADPYRHADIQPWSGASSPQGKRILLWAEQGHGDTIQFCRYATQLAAQGAKVILEVPPSLHALMQSLAPEAGIEVVSNDAPPPAADFQLPLMSLPLIFDTDMESIPSATAYLQPSRHKREQWQPAAKLPAAGAASKRRRIGLVCSGNAGNQNDARRSIALQEFAPLFDKINDADFFLLQPDPRAADLAFLRTRTDIAWPGEQVIDFDDSAALIASMDLLISVDTAAAHLAGALGIPVWILLPWAPDWRWFLGRDDSPWYPAARLFRQTLAGEWGEVLAEVQNNLGN
ncbi:tetratricopeptide repeat protein [Herbaspirillum lusitanum]|uniref:Tetratricopeptide repeat protein n=1 Tax=Herbaspirillum lusitanum TaxID=213312 RepID=A0ABW9AAZ4_9BURK